MIELLPSKGLSVSVWEGGAGLISVKSIKNNDLRCCISIVATQSSQPYSVIKPRKREGIVK